VDRRTCDSSWIRQKRHTFQPHLHKSAGSTFDGTVWPSSVSRQVPHRPRLAVSDQSLAARDDPPANEPEGRCSGLHCPARREIPGAVRGSRRPAAVTHAEVPDGDDSPKSNGRDPTLLRNCFPPLVVAHPIGSDNPRRLVGAAAATVAGGQLALHVLSRRWKL
jgi:hypothetical protein